MIFWSVALHCQIQRLTLADLLLSLNVLTCYCPGKSTGYKGTAELILVLYEEFKHRAYT